MHNYRWKQNWLNGMNDFYDLSDLYYLYGFNCLLELETGYIAKESINDQKKYEVGTQCFS